MSTINLSQSETWNYQLKTFPRPTGRNTHAIITEYDLPRQTMQPHDVIVTEDGSVWFSNFGELRSAGSIPRPARSPNIRCRN